MTDQPPELVAEYCPYCRRALFCQGFYSSEGLYFFSARCPEHGDVAPQGRAGKGTDETTPETPAGKI